MVNKKTKIKLVLASMWDRIIISVEQSEHLRDKTGNDSATHRVIKGPISLWGCLCTAFTSPMWRHFIRREHKVSILSEANATHDKGHIGTMLWDLHQSQDRPSRWRTGWAEEHFETLSFSGNTDDTAVQTESFNMMGPFLRCIPALSGSCEQYVVGRASLRHVIKSCPRIFSDCSDICKDSSQHPSQTH